MYKNRATQIPPGKHVRKSRMVQIPYGKDYVDRADNLREEYVCREMSTRRWMM